MTSPSVAAPHVRPTFDARLQENRNTLYIRVLWSPRQQNYTSRKLQTCIGFTASTVQNLRYLSDKNR